MENELHYLQSHENVKLSTLPQLQRLVAVCMPIEFKLLFEGHTIAAIKFVVVKPAMSEKVEQWWISMGTRKKAFRPFSEGQHTHPRRKEFSNH